MLFLDNSFLLSLKLNMFLFVGVYYGANLRTRKRG